MAEFKRSLLHEIKARPEIWNRAGQTYGASEEAESAWMDIQTTLGAPMQKMKNIWTFFCKRYYRILMTKAIERNDEAPKWMHFHDMAFMYELMTEKIRKKLGGISPPLLRPCSAAVRPRCPCCIPSAQVSSPDSMSLENPSSLSAQPPKRRRQPLHVSSKGMRCVERERIIDAIKAYPALYDRDASSNLPLWFAWRKVGEKVGIPLLTIQNRWRQFKRRYLDELMKERSSRGPFRSSWPNFEQMSFMRELMRGEIADLERIRKDMEQLVKQKRTHQPMTYPVSDEDIQCWDDVTEGRDEDQDEGDDLGVVTLDLTSEGVDDVILLSDEEESAESHFSEEMSKSHEEEMEIICIDDDECIECE